ncbi:hypothetical protein B5M09_003355 [Aphanomyces astaci]|uniref:N-acetyltransferase domain-containing protein n=1 Tax=Aphanomyces astaci TaxID=112090 RepID=A0A425D0A7_APHAT|nr:hypothetical protein B5M09_003355 [Aphanomyces astaci]
MRRADPIGTNQIGTRALSAALGLEPETDFRFWVVRRENDAGIDAVAMWTSFAGIFLSPSFRPSDAAEFGHHLAQLLPDPLPQSSGRIMSTQSFNEGYCAERYPPLTPQWKETLLVYVLDQLNPPQPVEGSLVTDANNELLIPWIVEYCEALQYPQEIAEPYHKRSMERQSLYVWQVNGRVVGFAAHYPPVVTEGEAIFRVGPVFVTPQERRKGYASAMTAELSRQLKVAYQTSSRVMLFAMPTTLLVHSLSEFAALTSEMLEAEPFGMSLQFDDFSPAASANLATRYWVMSRPVSAFAMVSPKRIAMSRSITPLEAQALGSVLSETTAMAPHIQGPLAALIAFIRGYREHWPTTSFVPTATFLTYVLDNCPGMPPRVKGTLRAANATLDKEVLEEWSSLAAQPLRGAVADVQGFVTREIEHRSLYLWDVNGYPVGCIGHSSPVQVCKKHRLVVTINVLHVASPEQDEDYGIAMLTSLCQHLQESNNATACRVVLMVNQDNISPTETEVIENAGFGLQQGTIITADLVHSE